jgi:hypothetical protein
VRHITSPLLVLVLSASGLMASSPGRVTPDALVGVWIRDAQDLVLRADGTWRSDSTQEEHYGNWHISDAKLIQTDWSGSGPFVVIWAIVAADNETLLLRLVETAPGHRKHYDIRRRYKRTPDLPSHAGPNHAMQPTASPRTV